MNSTFSLYPAASGSTFLKNDWYHNLPAVPGVEFLRDSEYVEFSYLGSRYLLGAKDGLLLGFSSLSPGASETAEIVMLKTGYGARKETPAVFSRAEIGEDELYSILLEQGRYYPSSGNWNPATA